MAKEVQINRTGIVILCAVGVAVILFLLYTSRGGYTEEKISISELLSASIHLAELGGRRVVEVRRMDDGEIHQVSKGKTKEGANEYVTIGDKESHEIITSGFRKKWPNLRFQSEENDPNVRTVPSPHTANSEVQGMADRDEEVFMKSVTVWIDPLDATQEFTEGAQEPDLLKFVTVLVCIAINGEPIAGVIHQPFIPGRGQGRGITKWGWVGHGVSRSLYDATSTNTKDNDKLRVIASRSHAGDVFDVADKAFEGWKKVDHIIAAGSGYKSLAVAEKSADLYLHTTAIKKWDICAGNAVLNALGGRMTTIKGEEIDYSLEGDPKNTDGILASGNVDDHLEFLRKLSAAH